MFQSGERDITDGLNKVDTLSERYRNATTQQEKDKIRAEYIQADRKILAGQKINEGNALCDQKKYREAIDCYNQALELNPDFAEAYKNRGICYRELGETAKAEADFAKAKALGYFDFRARCAIISSVKILEEEF